MFKFTDEPNERFLFSRKLSITFGSKRKFQFGIIKSEGIWCWWRRIVRPKYMSTHTSSINFITRWRSRFNWYRTYRKLKRTNTLYKLCQGCGEGISTWKIRDPNFGCGNHYLNCCDGCIDFYNIRGSAMDIIGWKNGKEVAKRRC